jgi:hypothetical protein
VRRKVPIVVIVLIISLNLASVFGDPCLSFDIILMSQAIDSLQ